MKLSAIPAQITTVEDRIAGNLNLTQIVLLSIPLFLAAVIFFILPPIAKFVIYKLIIALILGLLSSSLAIRLNGRLLLDILKLRVSFELRPHQYVYRKQMLPEVLEQKTNTDVRVASVHQDELAKLTATTRLKGQRLLADSNYRVVFNPKDGGLSVRLSAS